MSGCETKEHSKVPCTVTRRPKDVCEEKNDKETSDLDVGGKLQLGKLMQTGKE